MKTWDRLKRLWALAEYEPIENNGDLLVNDTKTAILIKARQQDAKFIPYNKKTPAQEIVEQSHAN